MASNQILKPITCRKIYIRNRSNVPNLHELTIQKRDLNKVIHVLYIFVSVFRKACNVVMHVIIRKMIKLYSWVFVEKFCIVMEIIEIYSTRRTIV